MSTVQGTLVNIIFCCIILLFSRFLWNYVFSPLKSFPGPVAASFTNLWRLQDVFSGRCHITHLDLHRKLGSVVRMGPNVLSLSDPQMLNQVYTSRKPWLKSDLYNVNDVLLPGGIRLKNLFSHQDEQWHLTYIRPVKGLYSIAKSQDFEPAMDVTINLFIEKMEERFMKPGKACDIADYISYLAWDLMSQVTFSKDLGMLETGCDTHKLMETSNKTLDYFASISQIPKLDRLFDKNPFIRLGPPSFEWATNFVIQQYQDRLAKGSPDAHCTDYLDHFIDLKSKHPDIVDDNTIVMYTMSNVVAGSDTTASAMCSALYHVLKHPEVHEKLCQELRSAHLSLPAQWKNVQGLQYLDAVMREAMRLTPGLPMLLERVVPEGGFYLPDGRFVPEGTIVGMNSWVVNRNNAVFGDNTDSFIPERWLPSEHESNEQYQARLSKMKGTDMTFGAGPRIKLSKQDHEWTLINSWFTRQHDIPVIIQEIS
ncbi:cytochrome P450 [Penicillium angulare]|uniref:cytochrome P450 n=1 Tax=Penicillium angulare TaxID=116970 RepID=UPI0025411606|nr:cytochrome P450 [Penicillium angulare]KAJ5263386.1 cytochrome P450 [Penicillium angulare]